MHQRLMKRLPLQFTRLQQGHEPIQAVLLLFLHGQPGGEQFGKGQIRQVVALLPTATDGLQARGPQMGFLQFRDHRPEASMGPHAEVFLLPAPQVLADLPPQLGAMQIQQQDFRLGPFLDAPRGGGVPAAGAPVPTLAFHLLAQIVFQLQRQPRLPAGEAFRHLLQVAAAHGALGEFAQQRHQGRHRLLELIALGEIATGQHLLDLPIEPERSGLQQGTVAGRAMEAQVVIGVLAVGELEHAQIQLALQGQVLDLSDGPLRRPHTGPVGVEVEHQPLAVAAATELGDLLLAEGCPQGGHRMADARRMEADGIEIALHHHRQIGAPDRIRRPIQGKEMEAFGKHLRFR